ncbi:MAG TPA: cellulase family glycosylhydrolase, partial [Lichenihabitans sp.]|nr:cellulase family glycosylhydrolase [Lichenihabitans sp.]
FADLWGKLAGHFAGSPNVIFGLMNEPQQSSAAGWLQSVNGAIASIRAAGARQEVLVPGIGWDGAWTWTTDGNASVIGTGVVDPANNFAFEVHQYLDSDGSGTHANVVSANIGVQRLQAITQWAENTGNRLFLGEFGVAADATSLMAMSNMLAYMDQHTGAWQGATYWAAGPWWGSYMYSAEPSNGVDAAQMTVLDQYKHVAAVPPTDAAAGGGATPTQTDDAATTSGTSPTPSQASPAPGTTSPTSSQASTPPSAAATIALPATAIVAVPAAIANRATVSAQPDIAATPASVVADVSGPLAAAPVAGPTITVDPSVSFGGPRSVVLSGTASAPLGVTAVDLFEGGTHLGTAAIASDGTWSLSLSLSPGLHTGLSAVATDAAGNTGSAPTNYDLTTVGNRPGLKASIDNYDASGSYLGTTQYNANGGVYLQWTVTGLPHGQTEVSYTSGTSLKQRGLSSLVETFGAAGRLVAETQTVAVRGTHALAADGGHDTFVFNPAFGQDLIAGFTASGNAHDTLSLPAAEFGSIAAVLNNATQQGADTVISAHNGDTITLQAVAKADLTIHDVRLHA